MIQDLATQPFATPDLSADVCIVGAGPAGIALALELARKRSDWRIVLLEAGGLEIASPQERDIYAVGLGDKSYSVLDVSRRRMLGGTTAHWGGWCKPPDPIDFEPNPRWDLPAWPLQPSELGQYFDAAYRWCQIEQPPESMASVRAAHGEQLLARAAMDRLDEQLFHFSPPTRFAQQYAAALQEQENLTCVLHANLYQLERRGERITRALVRPLETGAPLAINAENFVLAMGGMESTRHLLHLRGGSKADGPGIHSDHLGRYFADHFGFAPARLLAPAGLIYHKSVVLGQAVMPVITFSAAEQRREGHNNSCLRLYANSADSLLPNHYGKLPGLGFKPGEYWNYDVKITVEPRPHRDSRLRLTNERCALGIPRLHLDWQLHPGDFDSAYRLLDVLGEQLGRSGLGRLRVVRENSPALRAEVTGGCHHMGTARMAADPGDGVTDPDLKIHGMANLYLASSAVFPRYGYSNPTLTIVALAVRLADHLAAT